MKPNIKPNANLKKEIVVIGGGTGVSSVLTGLKTIPTISLTAIVPASDEGGSTGAFIKALRKRIKLGDKIEFSPPGDIANVLMALSLSPSVQIELLKYRFNRLGSQFKTHSLRNFIVAAALECYGLTKGSQVAGQFLQAAGKVFPVAEFVPIKALLEDGTEFTELSVKDEEDGNRLIKLKGEAAIDFLPYQNQVNKKIIDLRLGPLNGPDGSKIKPAILESAKRAILQADLVIFAPSDIWTSLIPILLIPGTREALRKSRAYKTYFCPLMTKRLHTDNWSTDDFVSTVELYSHKGIIDCVFFNNSKINPKDLKYYAKEESAYPVRPPKNMIAPDYELKRVRLLDLKTVVQDKVDVVRRSILRHDPEKIKRVILKLIKKELG